MPNEIKAPGLEDGTVLSADRAAEEMLKQSRPSFSPDIPKDREDDLDKAFEQVSAQPQPDVVVPIIEGAPKEQPKPAAPAEEVVDDKTPKPEPKAEPKAEPAPEPKPAAAEGRKGLLDGLVDEPKQISPVDEANEAFDKVKLRSDASPKTHESFDNLKKVSKELIERERAKYVEIETKKAELEKQLAEVSEKVGKLSPEVEAELKELREYRALREVEVRPEINQPYADRIQRNLEAIIPYLKAEEMPDANIEAMRKMDGEKRIKYLENVVLPKLPEGRVKHFIQAKLLDDINAADERRQKIESARSDADKILAAQKEAPERARQESLQQIVSHLQPIVNRLPFFGVREIPTTASADEKREIEAHNAFALESQNLLKAALTNEDPKNRAEQALAVPLAQFLKRQLDAASSRLKAAEEKLAKIEKASATGRNLGAATPLKPTVSVSAPVKDSEDAVDDLFNQLSGNPR